MVLLEKLWDDTVAGPQPERGLGRLRKINTKSMSVTTGEGSSSNSNTSSPLTPSTPTTPSSSSPHSKDNIWRSVFHPGSNPATKSVGAQFFDKPSQPNSPTVYDWLYSSETRSKHR